MNNELIAQFAQIWRVFERLVADFDDAGWIHTGRKTIIPVRLSLHILQSTKYYLQDLSDLKFQSGLDFGSNWETTTESDLPTREDMLLVIGEFRRKTADWISSMDLSAANIAFNWAGKTKLGVVIFLLKHTTFHLGELSSLLNESKAGAAADNYVMANEEVVFNKQF